MTRGPTRGRWCPVARSSPATSTTTPSTPTSPRAGRSRGHLLRLRPLTEDTRPRGPRRTARVPPGVVVRLTGPVPRRVDDAGAGRGPDLGDRARAGGARPEPAPPDGQRRGDRRARRPGARAGRRRYRVRLHRPHGVRPAGDEVVGRRRLRPRPAGAAAG